MYTADELKDISMVIEKANELFDTMVKCKNVRVEFDWDKGGTFNVFLGQGDTPLGHITVGESTEFELFPQKDEE